MSKVKIKGKKVFTAERRIGSRSGADQRDAMNRSLVGLMMGGLIRCSHLLDMVCIVTRGTTTRNPAAEEVRTAFFGNLSLDWRGY
jgi:hypothetical protein